VIKPKQSLGQNFLIDDNITRKIVHSMDPGREDYVVEVGPGKGALTRFLAETAGHVLAVEIDGRLVDNLRAMFSPEQVTILHRDFLEVSLTELAAQQHKRIRLAGNLPYHLTSPILFKAFEERAAVRDLTIMVQREVARRITGKPSTKDYGILAVLSQAYSIPRYLFTVSPNCFFPKPNVESAVIRLEFFEAPPFQFDEKIFTLVVKTTFGKRRKTLRNSMQFLPYEPDVIAAILDRIHSENERMLGQRPEELSIEEFAVLAETVKRCIA